MLLSAFFFALLLMASSHHLGPHMLSVDSPQVQSLIASNNDFAVTLYKQLATQTRNENMIASPFSVSTAIGMLYAGAKGKTATEIEQAMGFSQTGLNKEDINSAYHTLLTEQRGTHEGYDLSLANSAWINRSLNVLQPYKDTLKDIYFAEEQEVEFGTKASTDLINTWVSQKTNGKISKLFDEDLDASTAMILINAIYFKGTWKTKFQKEKTVDEPFKNNDDAKNIKNVPMMHVESTFQYTESPVLQAQLLELPYKGGEVSMIIVLPTSQTSLENLHSKLTSELLEEAVLPLSTNKIKKVNLILPKFKVESKFSLKDALVSFGMESAFTREANLTDISPANLTVSEVLQKALIEVNEEGSEAAAATAVQVVFYSRPSIRNEPEEIIQFHATHPFMYLLRHNPTKTTLFMGNVNKF